MKVSTVKEAWTLAKRLFPTDYNLDSTSTERAGYKIYRSTVEGSNAYICDLGNRLELNYDDGHSENIWIEEYMVKDGISVVVGMYVEKVIFGNVRVPDVREITYHNAVGLVSKTLSDGRQGIEITLQEKEVASIGNENLAYIRFT